jgi:hypothetical protein
MTRSVFLLLLAMLAIGFGCSQPESPHFVPATAETSKATTTDREKPVREPEPPIKIEMH